MIPYIEDLYGTKIKALPQIDDEGEPCIVFMIEYDGKLISNVWLHKARYDELIKQISNAVVSIEGKRPE